MRPDETLVLPDFPELAFDSATHTYRLAGKRIPAVTTILKPLSAAYYKGIDEDTMKTAGDRGRRVHECIENFIKFGFEEAWETTRPYVDAFIAWWNKYQPIPLKSEYRFYHRLFRYGGTADLVAIVEGKLTLIDFKSTASVIEMLTRPQLEGYGKALISHGVPIEEKAILHLRNDGTFDYIPHKPSDSEAWEVFGAELTAYNYIQKYIA